MDMSFLGKRKVLLAGAAVLILGGGVWGVAALSSGPKSKLPKDLQQALKASADDPAKRREVLHAAFQNPNLTEEQRHELFRSGHAAFEQQMKKHLDEYFAAVPADRQAILDQHIDEMQAHMKERQQNRPQGATDHGPGGRQSNDASAATGVAALSAGGTPSAGAAPSTGGGPGGGWRGDHHGSPSREQRKDHFESRDPDQRVRQMAYFSALHARAQRRGIQMPGPGGRGGPGR